MLLDTDAFIRFLSAGPLLRWWLLSICDKPQLLTQLAHWLVIFPVSAIDEVMIGVMNDESKWGNMLFLWWAHYDSNLTQDNGI